MKKFVKPIVTVLLVLTLLIPTVAMLVTNAAAGDIVELAFNNIFVFEKWANNVNSTTVQTLVQNGTDANGNPQYTVEVNKDALTADIENGSFTLTKSNVDGIETYTCFGGVDSNNFTYYMAEVEPSTTYTFYYNVTGNIWSFTPFVFYYDAEGQYLNKFNSYATPGYNENSFNFTTPENAAYIQLRFTIGDTQANRTDGTFTSFTATVKDIAICKADEWNNYLAQKNMFSFADWASNEKSSVPADPSAGSFVVNTSSESIDFTTNSGYLWTGFGIDTAASNDAYYTIDVSPSTSYTLTYDISNSTLLGAIYCQPFIVEMDSSGKCLTYYGYETPQLLGNKRVFTTQATTARIQVVFAVINSGSGSPETCTVSGIGVYKTSDLNVDFETVTGLPHRQVYTEGAGNYTNLPVPSDIPEGKIFAGWYTGEDGTGELITSDTEISYESYTVYPKYETELDEGGLKISTPATKLTYTLGEKVDTAGLVLEATVTTDGGTNTYKVNSGYRYSPETVTTTAGTQTITVTYGGQSVSYDVTVVDSITQSVKVNDVATNVSVTNDEYFINLTDTNFNRYEITYRSDAYVKAILKTTATDGTTVSEEFFLEPSTSGSFASYIDGFLEGTYYTNISSISFEPLNKDFFTFELYSVETIFADRPTDNMQYQQDNTHKVGIDLSMGGAIAYIEELSGNVVASYYGEGQAAQVDYKSMISGGTHVTENVNLINRHDPGRFVQQSYYGTREDPYVTGDYNGVEWNYNPVQGGNYMFESSKIIDYRITSNEIYVKTRPLDWGKYSDEFANSKEGDWTDNNGNGVWDEDEGELMLDPRYGDEYITDSYMEAWYVFEDDMVKTYCRFVDYSGYPSASTTQELPAFYPIEPLNTFAYYNGETVWEEEPKFDFANAYKENEPDFWGVSADYNNMLTANGKKAVKPWVDNAENWAAFMGSDNENSFGIGIYSAGVTEFHYGTYPQIYKEPAKGSTAMTEFQFNNADMYEEGVVTMPDMQDATSYIAPVDTMTFESYSPYTYSYYIASGTLHDIREDFRRAKSDDEAAAVAGADIAVPETAYMTPSGSDAYSTIGEYYVNNVLDATNNYSIVTVKERVDTMSFDIHINGASKFTVDITNVTNPSDDIDLYDADGNEIANTREFALGEHTGYGSFDENYTLRFNSTGLAPNGKATAKWLITGYNSAGEVIGTYTAYTVLYAPGLTIGAVAEGRITSGSNNEISSWITGSNGIDHSQRAPLGSFHGDYHDSGRFIYDPLVYKTVQTPSNAGSQSEDDYIITTDSSGTTDDYGDNAYVLQTATNGADSSRSQSYLGLLKIDKSRYTNTNQIPNLEIGFDALRISSDKNNSLQNYNTYYVLGTAESYTATSLSEAPSGWTHYTSYTDTNSKKAVPFRETVVPAYAVTDDIEGKYIHALNQGMATYSLAGNSYATAGSSVLISLSDKGALRDSVTTGYGLADEDYIDSTYNKFLEKLEDAATVLGDPSADQITIDNAQKELDDAIADLVNVRYSLKYDNLFSAYEFSLMPNSMTVVRNDGTVDYEDGKITVVNDTITGGEAYTNYGTADGFYLIDIKPNTEYVFEYDVTTTVNSQAFLFFYNANGANSEKATNISVQTDRSGSWATKNESNSWIGNYQYGAGSKHYTIKFTTGATTTKVGFRFGNTSNDPTTSTFSNIKLIDSARYYADVTYAKIEDVYNEHDSYGTLQTLTRTGYTFGGWVDENGATVTDASIATEHKSIFSVWTENKYIIAYNANGGSGSISSMTVDYTATVTLSNGSGFTKSGCELLGWSTDASATTEQYQLGQTVGQLTEVNGETITLYAVWGEAWVNITFDNIFDLDAFNIAGSLTVNEKTDTGFKVTSTGGDANTGFSYAIDVEPGKTYIVSADITAFTPSANNSYDMYVQALNASQSGDSSFTAGSGVGVESGVYMVKHGSSAGKISLSFTAGATTEYIKIRFDANDNGSVLAVDNIRIFEDKGIEVSPVNKKVRYQNAYGELPTPTRAGYTFIGWYNGNSKVTETTTLSQKTTVYLTSRWQLADTALTADTAVIDFGTPITIDAVANDTIFTKAATSYGATASILGISTDNSNFATTAAGNYGSFKLENGNIVYTPNTVVNGTETVYYRAQLSTGDTTVLTSKITVAPASNVLYEENLFQINKAVAGVDWKAPDDAAANTTSQDTSTANDVYGYDSNINGYNQVANYSNGSALAVNVDATNKRSKIMSFTFTGEGFDLNGACGPDTGVLVVTLKDNDNNKMAKSYIVDTYYSDLDADSNSRYGETLYQVPLISENGLEFHNYTVQIVASYLPSMSGALNSNVSTQAIDGMTVNTATANSAALREALAEVGMEYVLDAETVDVIWFDDNSVLNGGMGVNTVEEGMIETQAVTSLRNVVDSIRVYNPIEDGNSYYISSEANAKYYNVIDNLVNVKDGNIITAGSANFAYIAGNDAQEISFDTYDEVGPKDELYLATATNAVTFSIDGFDRDSMKVMISLRAASGTPKAKFGEYQFDVLSNTEMYYDITNYIEDDGTVTIQNMKDKTLLSVGSLKITSESIETASLSTEFNLMTARAMMMAPAEDVEPNVPDVPEEPVIPEEPSADDNSSECWIIKIFKWLIEKFTQVFNLVKGILGF